MSWPKSADARRRRPARGCRTLACAVGALALYAAAVWTPVGQRVDSNLMGVGLGSLTALVPLELLQGLRVGSVYVLAALVAVEAVAALRAGARTVVLRCALGVLMSLAVATSLRRVLPRPDWGDPTYPFNTWPSGHVALATALILSAAALAPRRFRAQMTQFSIPAIVGVSAASIETLAHRPSDVLAGILLAGASTALVSPEQGTGGGHGPGSRTEHYLSHATGNQGGHLNMQGLGLILAIAVMCSILSLSIPLGAPANLAWLVWAAWWVSSPPGGCRRLNDIWPRHRLIWSRKGQG